MTPRLDQLPNVGAPATRALYAAGFTSLDQLAGVRHSDLSALHGVGPKAIKIIENALDQYGLKLA